MKKRVHTPSTLPCKTNMCSTTTCLPVNHTPVQLRISGNRRLPCCVVSILDGSVCNDVNLTITKMTNKILPVLWLFFWFLISEDQVFRTVRSTNHLNDFWMVKQSIQNRVCYHWILKQFTPFWQILVTCNDCWFLLVPSWYELEKQIGRFFLHIQITKLINNQQSVLLKVT